SRLPFVLVFNKVDVVSHQFAVEWMQDFEKFQAAAREDASYMGTLVNSMCLVLEEFYSTLKVVGVSAVTGEGMDSFFNAVDEAVDEFKRDYRPAIEKMLQERKESAQRAKTESLAKLMKDMDLDRAAAATGSGGRGKGGAPVAMDEVDPDDKWEEDAEDDDVDDDGDDDFHVDLRDATSTSAASSSSTRPPRKG
ncbi:hypothetical protein HK405_005663, partial [Cladochytrium tenue]